MSAKQTIIYHFEYADGTVCEVDASLDQKTLRQINVPYNDTSDWSRLEHHQCANCPLHKSLNPTCPLARVLIPLIDLFGIHTSHEPAVVTVTTDERITHADTTLQRGLSSLLGLVMATSGCPHTIPFQTMAHFHLPFASNEETTYRAAADYLLGQYFRNSLASDWQLDGLRDIYQQLQIVNRGISQRLRSICEEDAAVNAVILLDLFAKDIPYSIEEALKEISPLFTPTK